MNVENKPNNAHNILLLSNILFIWYCHLRITLHVYLQLHHGVIMINVVYASHHLCGQMDRTFERFTGRFGVQFPGRGGSGFILIFQNRIPLSKIPDEKIGYFPIVAGNFCSKISMHIAQISPVSKQKNICLEYQFKQDLLLAFPNPAHIPTFI